MKLFIALAVMVAYCAAVPDVPATFQALISLELSNGSDIIYKADNGFMAEDNNKQARIVCVNTTVGNQVLTSCNLQTTVPSNPDLQVFNYVKYDNGTVVECDQTDIPMIRWQSIWAWVPYARAIGENFVCKTNLNMWEFNLSGIEVINLRVGVSDQDPNTPVFLNITMVNSTTISKELICFENFQAETPRSSIFGIPPACKKVKSSLAKVIPRKGRKRLLAKYLYQQLIARYGYRFPEVF